MSNSLRLHESPQAKPPYPSPTPLIPSDSRPSSQWCHPAISVVHKLSSKELVCKIMAVVCTWNIMWHCPSLDFKWKTDLFQPCSHCWVFQVFWHTECSTSTISSFKIWNSSAGVPSPLLSLLVAMLSKSHLISHSKMSSCRWVITPSWLSRSLGTFWIVILCNHTTTP